MRISILRSNKLRGAIATAAIASGTLAFFPAQLASAAAPTIVNANFLESLAIFANNPADGGGNAGKIIRTSFVVKHDNGDPVTSIQVDPDLSGSCTPTGSFRTTANNDTYHNLNITEVPAHTYGGSVGSTYSFVTYRWDASADWGGMGGWVDANGQRPTGTVCATLKTTSAQTVSSGSSNIQVVRGDNNSGPEDYPYITSYPQSQFDQSLSSAASLTFTYMADDPDAATGTCSGSVGSFLWRTRNLTTGATTGFTQQWLTDYNWGSGNGADGWQNNLTINFTGYARGRYVVEGYADNHYDTSGWDISCNDGLNNSNNSGIFAIGSVDINYAAPSGLVLTPNPTAAIPANGGVLAGTASVKADASGFTDTAGQVQILDWDAGTSQGAAQFERDENAASATTTALSSPQDKAFNTDIPPGDYVVKANTIDNGSMIATSGRLNPRTGTEASTTLRVVNPTTATITGCSPSPVAMGAATTCTISVADTVTTGVGTRTKVDPTGVVSWTFDDTPLTAPGQAAIPLTCTLNGGASSTDGISTCTVSFNATITDTWTIDATYLNTSVGGTGNGDTKHRGSSAARKTVKVIGNPSSTSVTCGATVVNGAANTCTATVTDTRATGAVSPAGTITLYSGDNVSPAQGTCTLTTLTTNSSRCTVTVTPSTIGQKASFASYVGNPAQQLISSSSPSVLWNSTIHPTTTSLSCPGGIAGTANTCTVTVTDTAAPTSAPAGTVTVYSGPDVTPKAATCTLAAISSSQARCTVSVTAAASGQKAAYAFFSVTNKFKSSTSPTMFWTASGASLVHVTTTSVACPSGGLSVTCTVSVTDTQGGSPKGKVYLYTSPNGTPNLTTCNLTTAAPTATCTVTSTTGVAGSNAVYAYYEGYSGTTEKYKASTSPTVFWTASGASLVHVTTTSVSCPNGGLSVTCTVSVTDTQGGSPKGKVYLYTSPNGTPNLTTCNLTTAAPTATCTVTSTVAAAGSKAVYAYYEGYNGATEKYKSSQSITIFWTAT